VLWSVFGPTVEFPGLSSRAVFLCLWLQVPISKYIPGSIGTSTPGMSQGLWLMIPVHLQAYPGLSDSRTLQRYKDHLGSVAQGPTNLRSHSGVLFGGLGPVQEFAGLSSRAVFLRLWLQIPANTISHPAINGTCPPGMSQGLWRTSPAHLQAYPGISDPGVLRDATISCGLWLRAHEFAGASWTLWADLGRLVEFPGLSSLAGFLCL